MKAALPLLLALAFGCAYPRTDLVPAESDRKGASPSCRQREGLELCLRVRGWDWGGLRIEVEARNTGPEVILIDPAEFRCEAADPQGRTLERWPLDPWGDWLPWEDRAQGQRQLRKHSLAPGETIRGLIAFPLMEYRDARHSRIRISVTLDQRSFEFRFRPDPFLHPAP